jgi:hypothetical protein
MKKYCFSIYFDVEYAIEKVQENQEGQTFEHNTLASGLC